MPAYARRTPVIIAGMHRAAGGHFEQAVRTDAIVIIMSRFCHENNIN